MVHVCMYPSPSTSWPRARFQREKTIIRNRAECSTRSTNAQPYYDALVQKTMDFVALSEVEVSHCTAAHTTCTRDTYSRTSPLQVEEMYDLFTSIDTDGTGFVEMQEFFIFVGVYPTDFHKVCCQQTTAHTRLLSNYTCHDGHHQCVFKYMDEDNDGTLTFGE